MTTKDKIEDATHQLMADLTGAGGHFERNGYGMQFLSEALDAARAFVWGEGPKPFVKYDTPVTEHPQTSNGHLQGYPPGVPDPVPDLPRVFQDDSKARLADMVTRGRNGR